MPKITIYTKDYCPYCTRAKELLKRRWAGEITEIDVTNSEALQQEMIEESGGRRSVPQIFIGSSHIGGFDELASLDRAGKLLEMLK